MPFGMGIVVAGGRDDRIVGNLVEDQATYGIAMIPIVDANFWPSGGNEVRDNVVRRSGRADLALAAPSAGGDCFEGNDASTSLPPAIELLFPCGGFRPFPGGGGSMGPTTNVLSRFIDSLDGEFPHGDWREQPDPPANLPDMPDDPATAPPDPAIPEEAVPELLPHPRRRETSAPRADPRSARRSASWESRSSRRAGGACSSGCTATSCRSSCTRRGWRSRCGT